MSAISSGLSESGAVDCQSTCSWKGTDRISFILQQASASMCVNLLSMAIGELAAIISSALPSSHTA
jgi:hypothetical protein